MRIVFMGTPEYCVPTLSKLIDAGHEICAVFCQPDKPVGRKQVLTPPPVKVFATERQIPVYQPLTLRDGFALSVLREIAPDIIVVVAYGKILPKEILYLPKYGSINGHASLLPKLRGASPIQWAIVSGETQTGVTVIQMDEGMDTGDILSAFITDILPNETAGELFSRLSQITADLMVNTLKDIENGNITPKKQNDSLATYAPIIKKEMAAIDFSKSAKEIVCLVRGFNPWPVAFCFIDNKRVKVYEAAERSDYSGNLGEVIISEERLVIGCGDNTAIELITVQPEGKKPMSAKDYLKGHPLPVGTMIC
ncbi:MAG: methionyl-tRNA formyltransferase [Clostridia bacterium]|nr:methionyl-tRNA formyltransferase [Clostridia bacterium]